jgi:hypothetical protein
MRAPSSPNAGRMGISLEFEGRFSQRRTRSNALELLQLTAGGSHAFGNHIRGLAFRTVRIDPSPRGAEWMIGMRKGGRDEMVDARCIRNAMSHRAANESSGRVGQQSRAGVAYATRFGGVVSWSFRGTP